MYKSTGRKGRPTNKLLLATLVYTSILSEISREILFLFHVRVEFGTEHGEWEHDPEGGEEWSGIGLQHRHPRHHLLYGHLHRRGGGGGGGGGGRGMEGGREGGRGGGDRIYTICTVCPQRGEGVQHPLSTVFTQHRIVV